MSCEVIGDPLQDGAWDRLVEDAVIRDLPKMATLIMASLTFSEPFRVLLRIPLMKMGRGSERVQFSRSLAHASNLATTTLFVKCLWLMQKLLFQFLSALQFDYFTNDRRHRDTSADKRTCAGISGKAVA